MANINDKIALEIAKRMDRAAIDNEGRYITLWMKDNRRTSLVVRERTADFVANSLNPNRRYYVYDGWVLCTCGTLMEVAEFLAKWPKVEGCKLR